MAAKRKTAAKRTVQKAAKKIADPSRWKFGITFPIVLILILFAAAFVYGGYLESGTEEDEPPQVVSNFIKKDADLAVHYIDVGQGDSSLIVYKDKSILIDAGERDSGSTVVEYLQSLGIEKLDYVIATHPHSDHIGGLPDVINSFEIGTVIAPRISDEMTPTTKTYERFLTALSGKGLRLTAANAGDTYSIADPDIESDNTGFEILAPVKNDYDDLNNWSVVLKLVHGGTSFIFTGDAEKSAENDILDSGADVSADVLKVGHHGSSTSTSKAFLKAVSPSIAVIQCGTDNSYGHPHAETIEKLDSSNVKIYRNDYDGTVIIYSDGKDIRAVTEKGGAKQNVDN